MENTSTSRAVLAAAAKAETVLPPGADVSSDAAEHPSWVLMVMSFLGAQLVVLPFLGFLALASYQFFFKEPGVWLATALLLGGASAVLRHARSMFVTQIGFSGVLAGLALLVVALDFEWGNAEILVMLAALLALSLVVRVGWVQRVLGYLATCVALAFSFSSFGAESFEQSWYAYPSTLVMVALTLLWALWCAREPHWSAQACANRAAAMADGAGVALLLAAGLASTRHFWMLDMMGRGARGSADDPSAGLARIFDFGWPVGVQLALVVAAAVWLVQHWQLRPQFQTRSTAMLGLIYIVLALACLVVPQIGVVALLATVALGTRRWALLALAGLVLLAQLSGFYYALAWPLAHKAALLAGIGAVLALAVWALRTPSAVYALAPQTAGMGQRRWLAPLLIGVAGVVALGLVHRDVQQKEQVIAHGQKIFLKVTPRDPRSLMQGDYMALNFGFPPAIRHALDERALLSVVSRPLVVAQLDARGVAEVLRVARADEPLAAGEILLALKPLKGEWVLVTDAFYFPEGQGETLNRARYGEFRALPDGRALLVSLADEALLPVVPSRKIAP